MLKLTIKDLKLFFADKRALLLTFAIPIALITLFALAYGSMGGGKESNQTKITIADEDKTNESKSVIQQIDLLKGFRVVQTTTDSAELLVKKGDEAAILIFHKGFGDSLNAGCKPPIEFKYDAAKDAEVAILLGALEGNLIGMIGTKSMEKNAIKQFDTENPTMDSITRKTIHDQISKNFSSDESKKQTESFIKKTPLIAEEENSPNLIQAVAGTAIMMLLFSVTGMGASLLDEKQEGTLKKLMYSPLHANSILFGKMISTNIVSVFQLMVMFVFAQLAFGLEITKHIPSLLLMIMATSYACSSLGVFIASFAKTRQQVQGMSTLIILVMSGIGGSMIPIFFMPIFMQKLAIISINYWSIQGFFDVFWRMLPITDITFLTRILVLVLIGTVLNIIALQMFKKNSLKIS